MTNTEQLRTFLAIADIGNLTAAAAELHKTQSAVSAQLKKLESGLGVQLFERAPRGMVLTRHGERLLPYAKQLMRDLHTMEQLFADPLQGILRIGVPDDFRDGRLEAILSGFSDVYPDVNVHVTSGCTHDFEAAIARDELDIAVKSGPTYAKGEPFYEEDIVWVCAANRINGAPDQIPLAVLERDCWWHGIAQTALDGSRIRYRIAFSSSSFASVCSAVQAGLAVGIVPERMVTTQMRILDRADGLPKLPRLRRTILRNQKSSADLLDAITSTLMTLSKVGSDAIKDPNT